MPFNFGSPEDRIGKCGRQKRHKNSACHIDEMVTSIRRNGKHGRDICGERERPGNRQSPKRPDGQDSHNAMERRTADEREA